MVNIVKNIESLKLYHDGFQFLLTSCSYEMFFYFSSMGFCPFLVNLFFGYEVF